MIEIPRAVGRITSSPACAASMGATTKASLQPACDCDLAGIKRRAVLRCRFRRIGLRKARSPSIVPLARCIALPAASARRLAERTGRRAGQAWERLIKGP